MLCSRSTPARGALLPAGVAALLLACGGASAPERAGAGTPTEEPAASTESPAGPPADLTLRVDTTRDRAPISPWIYGVGDVDITPELLRGREHVFTFQRLGGNRTTTYNWENNASNAGSDYHHINDAHFGATDEPAAAVVAFVERAHGMGDAALVTVPIIDRVAADKDGGDVIETPDFVNRRFHRNVARSPNGQPRLPPDRSDGVVYQDAYVRTLERRFGTGQGPGLFYSLDNEPGGWTTTHPRIRGGDGSADLTYAEHLRRSVEFASAIRAEAPRALIFGPASFGFADFMRLGFAPDHNNRDYVEVYLQRMARAEREGGKRLLDVLDVHFYSSADLDGQPIGPLTGAAAEDLRMQLPRSLYDPTYEEPSWIVRDFLHEPIQLLPRLQRLIDRHYPGTGIAITEYHYGGGADIGGGVTQADILGAYARHGVKAASLWPVVFLPQQYVIGAFEMYRRREGPFGDVAVHAETPDVARINVWASVGQDDGRVVAVVVHRARETATVALDVRHPTPLTSGAAIRLDAQGPEPRPAGDVEVRRTGDRHVVRLTSVGPSVTTVILRP